MERVDILKFLITVALGVICANLTGCGQEMDLAVDYECTDGSTNTQTCKTWRQRGKITQEAKSCFSEDAIVLTRMGHKRIAEVRVGDELLGMDHAKGQPVFTKVRAWLHRNVHAKSEMTVIETDLGSVIASPKHSIAVHKGGEYAFASELAVGHSLVRPDGSSVTVRRVRRQTAKGYYSPLTHTSNFFVGTSKDSAVLAHSFAHLPGPRWYEPIVHGVMRFAETFRGARIHEVSGDEDGYLHPVMQFMLRLAPLVGMSPSLQNGEEVAESPASAPSRAAQLVNV
jgi:hypothetical protein